MPTNWTGTPRTEQQQRDQITLERAIEVLVRLERRSVPSKVVNAVVEWGQSGSPEALGAAGALLTLSDDLTVARVYLPLLRRNLNVAEPEQIAIDLSRRVLGLDLDLL